MTRSPTGFLTRQRAAGAPTMCVHGGTTATVLVILRGRRAVVANVGDSSALLCGGSASHVMRNISTWPGSAVAPAPHRTPESTVAEPSIVSGHQAVMEMSADHSPESAEEFFRMRSIRPAAADSRRAELLFVYDTLSASKMSCPPIFAFEGTSEKVYKTGRGAYYKNVRNEWATLVATPPYAQFQDALAFTRSLGDLHLQTYGVSHVPEVRWIDLTTEAGTAAPCLAITACSDGVWDNWRFEEVADFILDPRRALHPDAQAQAVDLMNANLERARVNFGTSADNMTAVVVYLTPAGAAPAAAAAAAASSVSSPSGAATPSSGVAHI